MKVTKYGKVTIDYNDGTNEPTITIDGFEVEGASSLGEFSEFIISKTIKELLEFEHPFKS